MPTKRQEQAQQTKQRITDIAGQLFAQKGYTEVTVADIARACGIAAGTMYHYFESKDDLMIYIDRTRFVVLEERIEQMHFSSFDEKLHFYLTEWFRVVGADDVNLSRSWYHLAIDRKVPCPSDENRMDVDIKCISRYLREGIKEKCLVPDTPVERIATDLVFSMYGASLNRCIALHGYDILPWSREFIDHVLALHLSPYRTDA